MTKKFLAYSLAMISISFICVCCSKSPQEAFVGSWAEDENSNDVATIIHVDGPNFIWEDEDGKFPANYQEGRLIISLEVMFGGGKAVAYHDKDNDVLRLLVGGDEIKLHRLDPKQKKSSPQKSLTDERRQLNDYAARDAGHNAKIAQEIFYQDQIQGSGGRYTNKLSELLKWDKNLTSDPAVTFVFGSCNANGYTFTTQHANGTGKKIVVSD